MTNVNNSTEENKNARDLKLIEGAIKLTEDHPLDRNELGFSARLFAQLSLPYKHPTITKPDGTKETPRVWRRVNGNKSLILRPALLKQGDTYKELYPFGVLPRFLLTWMTTEAVRTQSPELALGRNLAEFMDKLGLAVTGGKTGTITRLRDQMRRLSGSAITIEEVTESTDAQGRTATRSVGANFTMVSQWDLLLSTSDPDADMPLWEPTIRLTDEFFRSVMDSHVPVDLGALKLLSRGNHGPLAMDIYVWLASRLHYVRKPVTVTWEQLSLQFGSNTSRQRKFKETFSRNFRVAKAIYPGCEAELTEDGVYLRQSRPPVPYKPSLED